MVLHIYLPLQSLLPLELLLQVQNELFKQNRETVEKIFAQRVVTTTQNNVEIITGRNFYIVTRWRETRKISILVTVNHGLRKVIAFI